MGNKKAPVIRFKGYTEDWEQRKAKEICSISTGKGNTQDKIDNGKYPFYVRSATIERSNDYLYDQEAVLTVGDGVGTGKVFHYVNGKYNLHQRVYRMFDFNSDVSTKYFYYYFSKKFYRRVMAMTAKTSVDSVRLEMIADMIIKFPSVKEQKKIVKLFESLDDTIALHQDAIQHQQDLKKALLQKLFPVNGVRIPNVRFATFKKEWEQRKVFDMSEITFGGGTPQTGIEDYWQGNFPWIQSSDLKNDQLCNVIPTKFITDEAINKSATKAVPANSIAVVTRVGVGKLALIPYPYATSQDFLSLSNLKVGPWFGVYSLYVLIQKEINNIQGTSIKGMTKSDLLNKNIHIPLSLDEQTKIGNFFKQLDETIALHQDAIHKLQLLKQSLLQKMFVN